MDHHRQLADALLPATMTAGKIIMDVYGDLSTLRKKDDGSPVTIADERAEEIILSQLSKIEPDIPIIAEEAASRGEIPDISTTFFLIDPLDGTKEFVRGSGEFTINIALIENRRPVFGIVYAPALAELYVTLAANRAIFACVPTEGGSHQLRRSGMERKLRPGNPTIPGWSWLSAVRTAPKRWKTGSAGGMYHNAGISGLPSSSACWHAAPLTFIPVLGRPANGTPPPAMPFWLPRAVMSPSLTARHSSMARRKQNISIRAFWHMALGCQPLVAQPNHIIIKY